MDIYKERIRPLFDSTGKTGAELEILIGLPEKIISNWDKGRVKSYKNYAAQIAKYFKVDSDYILGRTDDPSPVAQKESPPQSGELTGLRKEAWDLIETMDDYTLRKFIKAAKAMLEV